MPVLLHQELLRETNAMMIRIFSVALAQAENPYELLDIAAQKMNSPENKAAIHPLFRDEIQTLVDVAKVMLAHPATKNGDLKGMSNYAKSVQ